MVIHSNFLRFDGQFYSYYNYIVCLFISAVEVICGSVNIDKSIVSLPFISA